MCVPIQLSHGDSNSLPMTVSILYYLTCIF
jgi:hypothetical protein